MLVESLSFDLDTSRWSRATMPPLDSPRTLVLAFGAPEVGESAAALADLAKAYPRSVVVGCSSAGEIHGTTVRDRSVSATITRFDKTDLMLAWLDVGGAGESFGVGQALAKKLAARSGLRGVLVLSEGLDVNGSELVRGLSSVLDESIVVTGGLSGDGTRFGKTWVAIGGKARSNVVAAVGFYGEFVSIGHGSKGGWDRFGPERVVTRSEGNVLYELDGKPALALYKEYLGERAKDLPASGLLFPLAMRKDAKDEKVLVRTLLAVDHEKQSMTFAGDLPNGCLVQLMKADFERLIGGASIASAAAAVAPGQVGKDRLVIAISCVGRRLVLGDRTEEEVEAVKEALPEGTAATITGFYSYGEISPYATGHCDLHNQTMTLTILGESRTPLPRTGLSVQPPIGVLAGGSVAAPDSVDGTDFDLDLTTDVRLFDPPPNQFSVADLSYDLDRKAWSGPMPQADSPRTLVLAFGAPEVLDDPAPLAELAKAYPRSVVVGCSSAGEIHGTTVRDRSISVTVTRFDKTDLKLVSLDVAGAGDSYAVGQALAKRLSAAPGLRGVLVLSEGLNVNGSELVRGINAVLDDSIVVTGGLSGDGTRFGKTWVSTGGKTRSNVVAAVGLYGDFVSIGHGSKGGWDRFGPERVVTRSEGNVLYELDGKPALALYKEYLGERAKDLPASGLLFPLAMRKDARDEKVLVRTLLAVDHEKQSMTFAGDLPKGCLVQLMKADFERLVGGASIAGATAISGQGALEKKDRLVIAISCVGRRLVLGERTEEEVEAVRDAVRGEMTPHITGFYSYGEISPYATGQCDLHNQTMTLTVIGESPVAIHRARSRSIAPPSSAPAPSSTPSSSRPTPVAGVEATRPAQRAMAVKVESRTRAAPAPAAKTAAPVVTTASRAATPRPPAARVAVAAREITPPSAPASGAPVPVSAVVPKSAPATAGFEVAARSYDLDTGEWSEPLPALDSPRTLVLAFGAPEVADQPRPLEDLAKAFPRSVVLGCSGAGEIHGTAVYDRSVSAAITRFEKTELKIVSLDVAGPGDSYAVGQALAKRLLGKPGLRAVLVLSEGLHVNGSELVRGLNAVLDESIVVTGGLSGDGKRFEKTWVAIGGKIRPNVVAAVGLYGDHVVVGHGSKGGWDRFGPERVVTRSEANVLHELDGKPALALYKEYLGERAKDLPASGLLFPLAMRQQARDDKVLVRTLLAVDHEKQSMTFAGDLPKGSLVQLMKADFERLIGGASLASAMARETMEPAKSGDRLVIAISCVGRRLVLGDRTEEEVEAVRDVLREGGGAVITGFYSYGEISPYATGHCDLHNQTMTITVIGESPVPLPARTPAPAAIEAQGPTSVRAPSRPLTIPSPAFDVASPSRMEAPPVSVRPEPLRSEAPPSSQAPASSQGPSSLTEPSASMLSPAATRARPPVITRIPPAGQGASAPVITREQAGDVLVVAIAGRLTESFRGEALGRELSGTVVLDLSNVERVTSFGVREWLTMLGATAGRATLFLARCSDAVVNQLAMIRSFAGPSQVVSFFAPYLCDACGEPFERLFDCEDDAAVIRGKDPGPATCPRCSGKGSFDDDPRTFFAFALPHAATPVPAGARAVLDALAPPEGPKDAVEKTVTGDLTRVHVHRAVKQIRWARIFDGIEGRLELDIGGASLDADGAASLLRALRGLGGEITSIRIERCPRSVLAAYGRGELPAITKVGSVVLEGYCPSCAAHRPAVVQVSDPDARVECKRCGELLEVKDRAEAIALAAGTSRAPAPSPAAETAPSSPAPAAPPAPVVTPAETKTQPVSKEPPRASGLTIGLGIAVVGLLGILGYTQLRGPSAAVPSAAAVAPAVTATATAAAAATAGDGWMSASDLPPAWVDRPFVLGDTEITLVGHATGAATPEAALKDARLDAVRVLVGEIQRELAPGAAHEFLKQREPAADKRQSPEIARRFLDQMGSFASPERVENALRRREQGIEAFVRYKLPAAAYQRAIAEYKATHRFIGMELGRYFPLLESTIHSEAEIVVLSVEKSSPADVLGIRPGDFVRSAGGAPAPSIEALRAQLADEQARAAPGSAMAMEIESAGARRTVRFPRPPQP